jgi:hypothetical protein
MTYAYYKRIGNVSKLNLMTISRKNKQLLKKGDVIKALAENKRLVHQMIPKFTLRR